MELSDDAKAILLLTGELGMKNDSTGSKPLTLPQWNRLWEHLEKISKRPRDLFHEKEIVHGVDWRGCHKRSEDAIEKLLDRGSILGAATQRWTDANLWVVTYLDRDYPVRIKKKLPNNFPPLFFGVGNRSLIQRGGLAVVGSRAPKVDTLVKVFEEMSLEPLNDTLIKVFRETFRKSCEDAWFKSYQDDWFNPFENTIPKLSSDIILLKSFQDAARRGFEDAANWVFEKDDLAYAKQLGAATAREGKVLISGGAKGVDLAAMNGALKGGGDVVGVLSHMLFKRALDRSCHEFLENDNLVFVSETDPEVKLNRYEFKSAAMGRNKYIYCLSDAAVVVRSGKKGGTFSGAVENLKASWVPVWVKKPDDPDTGNEEIVDQGGNWLSDDEAAEDHVQFVLDKSEPTHPVKAEFIDAEPGMIRKAVILLTIGLDEESSAQVHPMDLREWAGLVLYLLERNLSPAHLLIEPIEEVLKDWDHSLISTKRIKKLLDTSRQDRLTHNENNWRKSKIEVAIRGDSNYPKLLKTKLGHDSPPVLFITGNKDLLFSDSHKIAVLGSLRSANESDIDYAKSMGGSLARNGILLISSNKTKIEQAAVQSCLDQGGSCIDVLGGNLQTVLAKSKHREFLEGGRLTLLSATPPHAKPTPCDADQHYDIANCLSSSVVVVRSGKKDIIARSVNRCMQSKWVPVYCRSTEELKHRVIAKNGYTRLLQGDNTDRHVELILESLNGGHYVVERAYSREDTPLFFG